MNKNKTSSRFWDSKIVWVILAIVSSVLLWVYVTIAQGDVITERYTGVAVEFVGRDALREEKGYIIMDISDLTVSVSLTGTRSELSKIKASSMVAVIELSSSNIELGSYEATPEVTFAAGISTGTIEEATTLPATISYNVVKEITWTVPVKGEFNGTPAEEYTTSSPVFDPETVTLRGPEDEVKQVAYVWVDITREELDATIEYNSSYTLMDEDGNEVPLGNIELEQDTVHVTVQVSRTKEVPIEVILIEGAGATAENTLVTCDPQTITISGDREVIDAIEKITVGPVDLTSFASTYEGELVIVMPDGVTNVTGTTTADVTIQIVGLETKTFTVTNFGVTGLTEGYSAEYITESLEVIIRGPADILSQIQASNIRVVADTSDIGAATGEFEPAARVIIDGFTGVGAITIGDEGYKLFIRIESS